MVLTEKVLQAFLVLLQAGLWENTTTNVVRYSLTESEWEDLYSLSKYHTVEAIVYDGIQKLPQAYVLPTSLVLRWTVRTDQIEKRYHWMNDILVQQSAYFDKHDLFPTLLKGQGLARYYAMPSHRICGDIDWYFEKRTDYNRVNLLLQNANIPLNFQAGFSVSYHWKGCEVEHHQKIFDLHNPFNSRYLRNLEKKEASNQDALWLADTSIQLPAPLVNALQVNAHILKHLLSFGIGIRQLCDAARLYYFYANQLDGEQLKHIYKKLGILKWIDLLHDVLVRYLGLDKRYLPFQPVADTDGSWMMHDILVAGNFGFYDEQYNTIHGNEAPQRVRKSRKLWHSFRSYVKVAPWEAISFPIVQFLSKGNK